MSDVTVERPIGMPGLNCARTDEHEAHPWDGKPMAGGRRPRYWCDPSDPLADTRLADRVRADECKAARVENIHAFEEALEAVEWARNSNGGAVSNDLIDTLTETANRALGHIHRDTDWLRG